MEIEKYELLLTLLCRWRLFHPNQPKYNEDVECRRPHIETRSFLFQSP